MSENKEKLDSGDVLGSKKKFQVSKGKKSSDKKEDLVVEPSEVKIDEKDGIKYTSNGVLVSDIENIKRVEERIGLKVVNPFGTNDAEIFQKRLAGCTKTDLENLAMECGIHPEGTRTRLRQKLWDKFKEVTKGSRTFSAPDSESYINSMSEDQKKKAEDLMNLGI